VISVPSVPSVQVASRLLDYLSLLVVAPRLLVSHTRSSFLVSPGYTRRIYPPRSPPGLLPVSSRPPDGLPRLIDFSKTVDYRLIP